MKDYRVRVSRYMVITVEADSAKHAKEQVWEYIHEGFTYGHKNKAAFMKAAKIEN